MERVPVKSFKSTLTRCSASVRVDFSETRLPGYYVGNPGRCDRPRPFKRRRSGSSSGRTGWMNDLSSPCWQKSQTGDRNNLPSMLQAADPPEEYQLVVAGARATSFYEAYTGDGHGRLSFRPDLSDFVASRCGLGDLGTATLRRLS